MTRINCGIEPVYLTDWHLIAEINELPRVIRLYNKRIEKGKSFDDIPEQFTLGKGHVTFFFNKLKYIERRRYKLLDEFLKRKLDKSLLDSEMLMLNMLIYQQENYNNYYPTIRDKKIVVERIIQRIQESEKFPWYYGKRESKEEAINRILKTIE